jgi:hypothetical protein
LFFSRKHDDLSRIKRLSIVHVLAPHSCSLPLLL